MLYAQNRGQQLHWSCFAEIVDVISKIVTTAAAVFGAWVAYQTLLRTPAQEPESGEAEVSEKEITVSSEATVFETSHQTTRLKVTDKGLECYLEDSRTGKGDRHQWTLTKQQAKEILPSRNYTIYPGYKSYYGVFSIGPRKNWLYSKRLFPEPGLLKLELDRLLKNAST